MSHSNQIREFVITADGLDLVDVYLGTEGVLTGSARESQQLQEVTGAALRDQAINRKDREVERKRLVLESKIASLQQEFESVQEELNKTIVEEEIRKEIMEKNREQMIRNRHNDQ